MDRKGNVIEELYEDDIEKIKTMEEKQQENRRLIHSLTNIFGDVYEADVLQKQCIWYIPNSKTAISLIEKRFRLKSLKSICRES